MGLFFPGQDLSLVRGAGDGGTPDRRRGQKQGAARRSVQTARKQRLRETDRSAGAANEREKAVDKALRSAYFEDLDEIGEAYELESRKPRITIRRPFQIGIAVYQLAKLRMLEFYYDFLDKYVDRRDFELIQMDTDSNYMAISGERLEDIVRPELKAEFEAEKNQWLSWDKWSGRTPGLFKLECEGSRMIALCSKRYYVDEADGEKKKFSTKGMSKKQNEITWQQFEEALEGSKDMATNRGLRMRDIFSISP